MGIALIGEIVVDLPQDNVTGVMCCDLSWLNERCKSDVVEVVTGRVKKSKDCSQESIHF